MPFRESAADEETRLVERRVDWRLVDCEAQAQIVAFCSLAGSAVSDGSWGGGVASEAEPFRYGRRTEEEEEEFPVVHLLLRSQVICLIRCGGRQRHLPDECEWERGKTQSGAAGGFLTSCQLLYTSIHLLLLICSQVKKNFC